MEQNKMYENFTKCLADLLYSSEKLDILLLIESLVTNFDVEQRDKIDSDKKLSFEISSSQGSVFIEINMNNKKQHIRSFNAKLN